MKVLICGSYESALTMKLILRLKKEHHEIYVLNNDSPEVKKPKGVFQDYRFPYQSDSNVNVLSSISPDVVVALGAFDEAFDWEKGEMKQGVMFDAGLLNIISCSAVAKVKRFIYLSCADIFSGNEEKTYEEDTLAYPETYRQKAILHGEKLLKLSNATEKDFEISILRFPEIFGVSTEYAVGNTCERIIGCLENDIPFVAEDKKVQMVYVDDAVDAIYKVVSEDSEQLKKVYHIAPKEECTEFEVAQYFNKYSEMQIAIQKKEESEQSNGTFISKTEKELGYNPKYSVEDGMNLFAKQYATLQKKQKYQEAVKNHRDKRVSHKLMPYIETIASFAILQMIYSLTSDAAFYQQIDIYLVFSLIIAVILGAGPTALAVILCTVAKFSNIILGDISQITNYQNYLWELQLFALSVLVGFLRDRYNRIMDEKQLENDYLTKEVEALTAINDGNVEVKEVFEKRLVNYRDSTAKVYEMVSELDELEANGVLFKSAKLIANLMNSKDVALYTYEQRSGFCRLTAATSDFARKQGNSIHMESMEDLREDLFNKKIYINHARDMKKPMFAAGTYQGNELQVVIMVWTMDLKNMNLHQSNMLSMLSKLLERSMSRAFQYMDSIRNDTYIPGTSVMEPKAFCDLLDTYCYGEKEDVLTFCVLKTTSDSLSKNDLYQVLGKSIRGTDYAGTDKDGNSYIVLTNSKESDADFVIERLKTKEIIGTLVEKKKGESANDCLPSIKFE